MKSIKRAITNTVIFLAAITLAGCSPESTDQAPAATTVVVEAPEVIEEFPDLSGTSWQLVNIMEMDGSIAEPGDRSLYTLKFGPEGQADMLADCNRGTGSWSSEASGQLQFGPIAASQALCPADSLSDNYLVQIEQVRSYVVKNGNLFLATMTDGLIMELETPPSEQPGT